MIAIPIWMYFVVFGIIISAFMAIRTGKVEREHEMESIEQEGKVYMERIKNERNNKKEKSEADA